MTAREEVRVGLFAFILVLMTAATFRHGINAAIVAWVAANHAFETEPETTKDTMFFNRFNGVVRTGRIKPATRSEQWADKPLIEFDR